MKIRQPETDLRKLRLNNINSPEFSHLKMLLFWPAFGLLFAFAERFYPVAEYHVMYHPVDRLIPFNEWFALPYIYWFVYMIGMHFYAGLYDRQLFVKMMKFISLTYTSGLVIFFLYPTVQHLRPAVMPRDNLLTRFMSWFYTFDTNTNVCPSLHVVGSMAIMYAGLNAKNLQSIKWKVFFILSTFVISISTVFLKQHSVIDLVVGFIICVLAYPLCFKSSQQAGRRIYRKNKIFE